MRSRFLSKASSYRRNLILVIAGGVPIVVLPNALDPINVPKLALVIVVLAIVIALRVAELLQGSDTQGLRLLVVPAAGFFLPLFISWLFSPYRGWALFGSYPRWLGLIPYVAVILFGILAADAFHGGTLPLAWALAISAGIIGCYAIVQSLGLDPISWSLRGTESEQIVSTLGNPNFVGAALAIVLPIAAVLVVKERRHRSAAMTVTGLIVIGWLLARSEGGWGAGIAGLAVTGGLLLARWWRAARFIGGAVAITIGLLAVGGVLAGILNRDSEMVPHTLKRRGDWWEAGAAMTADAPVVGKGPNAFAIEHSRYRTVEDALESGLDVTDDPHSLFVSMLTSSGAVGVLGLVVTLVWTAREIARLDHSDLLAAGFAGAVTAYFVQSLISIDTISLRVIFWAGLAGLVARAGPRIVKVGARSSKNRRKVAARHDPLRAIPALFALTLLAIVGVTWGSGIAVADTQMNHAIQAFVDGRLDEFETSAQDALAFREEVVYRRMYGTRLGEVAVALSEDGQEDVATDYLTRSKQAFAFTATIPRVSAIVDYARILRDWAALHPPSEDEATAAYEDAVEVDPRNVALVREAAETALSFEDYEAAQRILQPLAEEADLAELWGMLALANARSGDVEAARLAIARARELDPSDSHAIQAEEAISDT